MDRQSQIDTLLELYQHPEHKGALEDADVTVKGGNPGCGDIVIYHMKVGADGRISDLRFEGEGCTISQAAAELVAEQAEGTAIGDIEGLSHEEIIELLGREVVMSRPRCATLALGTLKDAVRTYCQQPRPSGCPD